MKRLGDAAEPERLRPGRHILSIADAMEAGGIVPYVAGFRPAIPAGDEVCDAKLETEVAAGEDCEGLGTSKAFSVGKDSRNWV